VDFLHSIGEVIRSFQGSDTLLVLGVWIAAGLTLFLFSFLYKDNPFFKIAEHLYLGAGMGWWFQVTTYNVLIPKVWEPLKNGDTTTVVLVIIPSILGLSLITQFIPRISWISRYGFTFMMGYSAGLAVPVGLATDFMNQILGAIEPFANFFSLSGLAMFNALLMAFGTICVLFYFFFSVEHKGVVKKASTVGIYFLMIYFGAAFGNTVMARFSLLYGRFDTLVNYSSEKYLYATPWITVGLVIYFVAEKLFLSGRKEAVE